MKKTCSVCGSSKVLEEFCKDARKPYGKSSECKTCKRLRSRKYRESGKDQAYWKRPDVLQNKKNWNKRDYLEHKEKYNLNNKKWIENNHERHRKYQTAYTASYRAYKKRATPAWTSMEEIFNFYKNCPSNMEVDHIIPLNHPNVCGLHVRCNFQYLSRSENVIKNNQWDGTYDNESWRRDLKKEIK